MIFSSLSGYDIRETVKIWERMKEFNKGKEPAEFMSTHPSADNRIKKINEWTNKIIIDVTLSSFGFQNKDQYVKIYSDYECLFKVGLETEINID